MILDEQQQHISKIMQHEGINTNTIDFFISLIDVFKTTETIESTSEKLADSFNKSTRSIQRYIKSLKDSNYVHVRPIWNNSKPDKPFIAKNIYNLTEKSLRLIDRGGKYAKRHKTVYFQ